MPTETRMDRFRVAFTAVVGEPDREGASSAQPRTGPVQWITRNIVSDLQWSGYRVEFSQDLFFGLNLEFYDLWQWVRPRLADPRWPAILASLEDVEWHWWGRPGFRRRNPPFKELGPPLPVAEVEVGAWLRELDRILDRAPGSCWDDRGRPMRPQMQMMRRVGGGSQETSGPDLKGNIRQVTEDLRPVIDLLRGTL